MRVYACMRTCKCIFHICMCQTAGLVRGPPKASSGPTRVSRKKKLSFQRNNVSTRKNQTSQIGHVMGQDLAHQNLTIAIASDFRVDGAKSPEILQKEEVLGSEIAARNRKSLATFHRTLKSQCSIAFSCLGNRCNFSGPRWAPQSKKSQKNRYDFSALRTKRSVCKKLNWAVAS